MLPLCSRLHLDPWQRPSDSVTQTLSPTLCTGSDSNTKVSGITTREWDRSFEGPSQQPMSVTWSCLPLHQRSRPAKTPRRFCPWALRIGWMGPFPPHQPAPHFLDGPGILGKLHGAPYQLQLQTRSVFWAGSPMPLFSFHVFPLHPQPAQFVHLFRLLPPVCLPGTCCPTPTPCTA